jgi:hypothetical protein
MHVYGAQVNACAGHRSKALTFGKIGVVGRLASRHLSGVQRPRAEGHEAFDVARRRVLPCTSKCEADAAACRESVYTCGIECVRSWKSVRERERERVKTCKSCASHPDGTRCFLSIGAKRELRVRQTSDVCLETSCHAMPWLYAYEA